MLYTETTAYYACDTSLFSKATGLSAEIIFSLPSYELQSLYI